MPAPVRAVRGRRMGSEHRRERRRPRGFVGRSHGVNAQRARRDMAGCIVHADGEVERT